MFCPHPAGVRYAPTPALPYQALQPQKGCKTTFNCVVPAGHSVRGMPHFSTGLPSLPGRVQGIGMGGGRKHLRIGTLLPPPPISLCPLRRAPPFRCERSEQAEPPTLTYRHPRFSILNSQFSIKKGPPSGSPCIINIYCEWLVLHTAYGTRFHPRA